MSGLTLHNDKGIELKTIAVEFLGYEKIRSIQNKERKRQVRHQFNVKRDNEIYNYLRFRAVLKNETITFKVAHKKNAMVKIHDDSENIVDGKIIKGNYYTLIAEAYNIGKGSLHNGNIFFLKGVMNQSPLKDDDPKPHYIFETVNEPILKHIQPGSQKNSFNVVLSDMNEGLLGAIIELENYYKSIDVNDLGKNVFEERMESYLNISERKLKFSLIKNAQKKSIRHLTLNI